MKELIVATQSQNQVGTLSSKKGDPSLNIVPSIFYRIKYEHQCNEVFGDRYHRVIIYDYCILHI